MKFSSQLTNEEATYAKISQHYRKMANALKRKNGVLFVGMILLLTGCWSPFWEHTPPIGTVTTTNQVSKAVKLPGPPMPPGMDAQAYLATASTKLPCAGKSIITTYSWGYYFTNPCSGMFGYVTNQPPKTNMVFTWNCGQWWKPYHTGLINIADGTPVCYIVAQPTNTFTTTNTGTLLVRAYSTL